MVNAHIAFIRPLCTLSHLIFNIVMKTSISIILKCVKHGAKCHELLFENSLIW